MARKHEGVIQVSLVVNGVTFPMDLKKKEFSTGSRGFYVWGKVHVGETGYQVGGNLVEIGSRPQPAAPQ